jgi:hypothetical protein
MTTRTFCGLSSSTRTGESFARHFSDPDVDHNHDKVFELLAEPPLRVDVHPVAFS